MSESTESSTAENNVEAPSFNPITSQADLDKIIGERIARERNKFADYNDLKAKASRLDELEESQKSELEKATNRATRAEERLRELEHAADVRGWKDQVSKDLGIPAEALAGNSLEEISAHGQILKNLFVQEPASAAGTQRHVIHAEREPALPLNGDGIENALRAKLGIS